MDHSMGSITISPLQRHRQSRSKRERISHALVATIFIVMVGLASALLAGLIGRDRDVDLPYHISGSSSRPSRADHESHTGIILFTSPNRDTCKEFLFDNTTGRRRAGVVDCKSADESFNPN